MCAYVKYEGVIRTSKSTCTELCDGVRCDGVMV